MRKFSQLSYHERDQIYRGICQGMSKKAIAKMLDRSISTITREVKRNSDRYGYSYPDVAQKLTNLRKNKNAPKIDRHPKLKAYIIKKLQDRWSPEMIAAQWSIDHEDEVICKETIYTWLYSDNKKEKLELRKLLIRKHKKRGLRPKKNKSTIKNRVSIHDRPSHINERKEVGHWECDLVFNSGSQSKNICTFIERVTRKALIIHNKNKLTKTVIGSLIERIKKENLIVKSITFDNGSEFADHTKFNEIGISTYFCDPGTPSQKGSVENFNGMLRRFVPFDLAAEDITEEYIAKIEDMINRMPRKILSYKTPLEVFKIALKLVKKEMSRVKLALPATEAVICNQK